MKSSIRLGRVLAAAVITALSVGSLAQAAAGGPAPPEVPFDVAVPAGNKVYLVGHATGVQIYRCDPSTSGFAWRFVAPRADLYDDHGKLIVTHFVGPSWRAKDGSTVVARRDGGVNMDLSAIDWLRLVVTPPTSGPEDGRLSATTYIQRLATVGGIAPAATSCNAATSGTVDEVPYTADYYFWKATG
jgi:uncharacterized protein DUF3455